MANIVEVQFTAFQNLNSSGAPIGERYLGYRIYDEYDADYNNTFDSIDAMEAAGLTPEGVFDYIDQKHDKFSDTIWERGVILNDQYIAPPSFKAEKEEGHAL